MRRIVIQIILVLTVVQLLNAQQPTPVRIGWLSGGSSTGNVAIGAFRAGMRELGYIEGRNLFIDARWGEGSPERLDQLAADLVRTNLQIIVTQGPAASTLRRAGVTIPVVFAFSGDPVEAKLVETLSRPGHNLTGLSFLSLDLAGKRMELLKEALPSLKRVAILTNPQHAGEQKELRASQAAAKSLGLTTEYFPASPSAELLDTLPIIAKSRSEAILMFPDVSMLRYSEPIAAFAIKNRIPAVSGWAEFAEKGNLMTYGPNLVERYGRLAFYVDKVLKGGKPSDLPVELPTKFELVINLNAAKQIGLIIPPNVLARADKVIK